MESGGGGGGGGGLGGGGRDEGGGARGEGVEMRSDSVLSGIFRETVYIFLVFEGILFSGKNLSMQNGESFIHPILI